MSLTTTGSNVPALAGGNPFLDAAEDMGASSGGQYLKFDGNTGIFSYGKDQEELPKGTRVAVNPNEFKNGWICWKDGEVQEEIMVRVVDGKPPVKGELRDHGPYEDDKDGWREQASTQFRDIETGEEYLFKTSSKGGRISVGNLVRDYGKSFTMHPGELAIVELQNTAFDAKDPKNGKKLGRKYAPVFKIVDWQSEQALIDKFAAAEAASDEAEAEAPADMPLNTGGGRRSRNF